MKPSNLKKIIDCFNSVGKNGDQIFLRIKGMDNSSLITSYTDYYICNVIIDEYINDCMIHIGNLEHLKAEYKKNKKSEDVSISKYTQPYEDPEKDLNKVMRETYERKTTGFNINFKNLEAIYKSMKDKSTTIRIDQTDNNRIIVTNENGDISFIGVT